ncbi:MAG TPA: GHMP kinase [Acidobacteriota bacterium]|nr:GHMP kinase [Acidobacteriota bacterium]
MRITAKAPTRIDFAGGTLDLWPLYLFFDGATTINAAINLFARATLESLPSTKIELISRDQQQSQVAERWEELDPNGTLALLARIVRHFAPRSGLRLQTESLAPAGSGLGGSSALAIAVAGALNEWTQRKYSNEELIETVRDIEAQVIGIPTGLQDYLAAVYGGFHAWHFRVQKVQPEPYKINLHELQERVLLFYSGIPRASGINNWLVYKNCIDRDESTLRSLTQIREDSLALHKAITATDWQRSFAAIAHEWAARKQLAPSLSTPQTEEILEFGVKNGAVTGRVCGAGGGGCLILLCEPEKHGQLSERARGHRMPLLDFRFVSQGLQITREES